MTPTECYLERFDASRNMARYYRISVCLTLFGEWVMRRWLGVAVGGREKPGGRNPSHRGCMGRFEKTPRGGRIASLRKGRCAFSHPDFTVGSGIPPDRARGSPLARGLLPPVGT